MIKKGELIFRFYQPVILLRSHVLFQLLSSYEGVPSNFIYCSIEVSFMLNIRLCSLKQSRLCVDVAVHSVTFQTLIS